MQNQQRSSAVVSGSVSGHNRTRLKRSAFVITDTDDNDIAAPASIGLSNATQNGYKMPAAIGTPSIF